MITIGTRVQARAAYSNVAAQTGIVSAGDFGPADERLSRHLKYLARVRIREFESSQPRHAVGLSRWKGAHSGARCGLRLDGHLRRPDLQIQNGISQFDETHEEPDR